jgi:hypothetical protein
MEESKCFDKPAARDPQHLPGVTLMCSRLKWLHISLDHTYR